MLSQSRGIELKHAPGPVPVGGVACARTGDAIYRLSEPLQVAGSIPRSLDKMKSRDQLGWGSGWGSGGVCELKAANVLKDGLWHTEPVFGAKEAQNGGLCHIFPPR